MRRPLTRQGWRDNLASLEQQASAGSISAMTDLGLSLLEGIQDRKGHSLVRRNPRTAVRYFREAASHGDPRAMGSLGYAYDVGLGVRRSAKHAIYWYRRAARLGSTSAASNLATVYRDAGKPTIAFRWWMRAADMGDGDAAVSVGYCYQYGIGTRKNAASAMRYYRRAIASQAIIEYGREEAMYHLSLQLMEEGRKSAAVQLLKRASADGDFPEAMAVFRQIEARTPLVPCRCRRFIKKALRGHAECSVHSR